VYDTFRDRLMFPIRDATGRTVGFGGRTLGDDKAKYINTRQNGLFDKGQNVYGVDLARKAAAHRQRAVVVEGYTDCIAAHQAGFTETVAIVQDILDRVKPQTTKLVMETESYLFPDNPEVYARLIEAIDRPSFAVHLDPVNIIASPRRYYFNSQFIKRCFAVLGSWIVSCHAKDLNMPPKHATVQIDETYIGNGVLDYNTYLLEIEKLNPHPTLMIEHLNESQLVKGLNFIFQKAEELGITFEGSEFREELVESEDSSDEWFAPHQ